MTARSFQLPNYQDLSKDQDQALELPHEGQHLVIGGPGTGKSVIVMLRARQLDEAEDSYQFLVYNHLLHQAAIQLFEVDGHELKGRTWKSWFYSQYPKKYGQVPEVSPYKIDWSEVLTEIKDSHSDSSEDDNQTHIIIDEGQDFPPEFYQAIINMGYENFYVVADQNQQITESNSSRQDIESVLAVDSGDVITLKTNFRNSYPVARLAQHFYTGDPASPPPDLPDSNTGGDAMLVTYHPQKFQPICGGIVKRAKKHKRKLIGILTANHKIRQRYYEVIRRFAPESLLVTTYTSSGGKDLASELKFNQGGIVIICAQSCKGLEFDEVFCADIHEHVVIGNDLDIVKKRFYVMVSRACESVFLLAQKGKKSQIDDILPDDERILKRYEVLF